jgi:hypothetical protein
MTKWYIAALFIFITIGWASTTRIEAAARLHTDAGSLSGRRRGVRGLFVPQPDGFRSRLHGTVPKLLELSLRGKLQGPGVPFQHPQEFERQDGAGHEEYADTL